MREINKIWDDLLSALSTLEQERSVIKRVLSARRASIEAMERLEEFFVMQNEFNDDPSALIEFNRNLAPPFYAKYIFFSKVWAFECL